jgi:hypothetical protein
MHQPPAAVCFYMVSNERKMRFHEEKTKFSSEMKKCDCQRKKNVV